MKYIYYFDFLPLVYLTHSLMSLSKVTWYNDLKPVLVVTRDRRSPWIWQRSVSPNEIGLHFHTVCSGPSVLHKTPTLWSPNCITVIRNRLLNNIHHVASYDKRNGWCYSHSTRIDELTTFYSFCWNHNVLYKQATTNCHTQFWLYLTSLMPSEAPRESSFQKTYGLRMSTSTVCIQALPALGKGTESTQHIPNHSSWRHLTHSEGH